jgi:hypothetical protein
VLEHDDAGPAFALVVSYVVLHRYANCPSYVSLWCGKQNIITRHREQSYLFFTRHHQESMGLWRSISSHSVQGVVLSGSRRCELVLPVGTMSSIGFFFLFSGNEGLWVLVVDDSSPAPVQLFGYVEI